MLPAEFSSTGNTVDSYVMGNAADSDVRGNAEDSGLTLCVYVTQGRTDQLEIRALPEGQESVGGPMRCPWYLFHRLF
ncbi:unnamed protein product [Staurois parvus]|uniref:Uncharacterized protein n=1 Tax=Staurois parvus TaxID=386267 RepID=A0ABN9EQD2_9NEOB|nr:unnamed protein product [Staurois parvus]